MEKTKSITVKKSTESDDVPIFEFHEVQWNDATEYEYRKMYMVEDILNNKLRIFHDVDYGREGKVKEDKQKRLLGDTMYSSILSGVLMNLSHESLEVCNGIDFYATNSSTRMEYIFPYGVQFPIFETTQYKAGFPKTDRNKEPKELPMNVSISSETRYGKHVVVVSEYGHGFIDRY